MTTTTSTKTTIVNDSIIAELARQRCNIIGCEHIRAWKPIHTSNGVKTVMVKVCEQHWIDVTNMPKEMQARVLGRFSDKAFALAALSHLADVITNGKGISPIETAKCGLMITRWKKSMAKYLLENGRDGQAARDEYDAIASAEVFEYIQAQKRAGKPITQKDINDIKDEVAIEVGLKPVGMGNNRHYLADYPIMTEKRAMELAESAVNKARDAELIASEDTGIDRFWARDPGHLECCEFAFPQRNLAEVPTGPEYRKEEDETVVNMMNAGDEWHEDNENDVETQEYEDGVRVRDNFSVNADPFSRFAREERLEKLDELREALRTATERGPVLARARNLALMQVIFWKQYWGLVKDVQKMFAAERQQTLMNDVDNFNNWL